jgi:hypothetical protein
MGTSLQRMGLLAANPILSRVATWLFLLSLYGLGIAHWVYFLHQGHVPDEIRSWRSHDWPKEFRYYTVLNSALQDREIPYRVSMLFHKHTDRFLGLPETNLSPQVLLLPYFKIGKFIVFNVCLLYTVGFVGCLALRRRYRLGLITFTVFFLLFSFNGYITSHLAVGHSMWVGYYLLPFFCLYILKWLEGETDSTTALKLAFVLFLMVLQGAFHMMIWCWMFLLLFVACNRQYWKPVALTLGLSFLLALFRLLPAAYIFWDFDDDEYTFLSGYPTLKDVLDGLIEVRPWYYDYVGGIFGWMGWWEYDVYVGILGLAFLVYFGIYRCFDKSPALQECRYRALDLPMAILAILSLSYFYAFICKVPLPLFRGERVSSRFLIIPLFMLLVIATIRMQRVLERVRVSPLLAVLLIGGVLQIAFSQGQHSYRWSIPVIEPAWKKEYKDEPPPDIDIHIVPEDRPDRWYYLATVQASAAVSLLALIGWGYWSWRSRIQPPLRLPHKKEVAKNEGSVIAQRDGC